MATSVIQEFLISLGFKVDEKALANFKDGIEKAGKAVIGLASAITATASIVAAGVARFASNLESLYFASMRTNTAVQTLKAMDRAAQNFGASAGEAQASIEALAKAYRDNPQQTEGLLATMGVNLKDINYDFGKAIQLTQTWFQQFGNGPLSGMASQRAGQLGISDNVFLALRSGKYDAEVERINKEIGNTNWQKAATDANKFNQNMRDLGSVLESFGVKVEDALIKRFGGGVEQLTAWVQKNGPRLADQVIRIGTVFVEAAGIIGKWVFWIAQKFVDWDKATHGWSTGILVVIGLMKVFGGFKIISGIWGLVTAFGGVEAGLGAIAAAAGPVLLVLGSIAAIVGVVWAAVKGAPMLNNWVKEKTGGEGITDWIKDKVDGRTQMTMDFFQKKGWTKEQAAGFVANLKAESGLDETTVGDHGNAYGLGQWQKPRQASFAKVMGKDIHNSTYEEQLEFLNYEAMRNAKTRNALMLDPHNARLAGESISKYLERPFDASGEASRRGQSAVQIVQNTTANITVDGSKTPELTGRAVKKVLHRTGAEQVRAYANVLQ